MNTDILPYEALAKLDQDGSMIKLIGAPFAVIAGVIVIIAIVRGMQRAKERGLVSNEGE